MSKSDHTASRSQTNTTPRGELALPGLEMALPSLQTSQLLPRGPFLRLRERFPGLESVCPDGRELSNPLPVLLSLAPHCTKPALRLQGSPTRRAFPRRFPGSQHSRTSIQFTVLHYVSPEFLRAASISSQRARGLPRPITGTLCSPPRSALPLPQVSLQRA